MRYWPLVAFGAFSLIPIASGAPVSLWKAEGNALDSIGSNHGVAQGGVGYRPGGVDQGFDFGGGSHVVVESAPAGGLVPVEGFTLAAWFQEDVFNNNASIINARPPSNTAGYTLEPAFGTPDSVLFAVYVGSGFRLLVAGGFTVGGRWHIAATYDAATGDMLVYRDGELVATLEGEPGEMAVAGADQLLIGKNIVTQNPFDGMIDEVQVFDRALSSQEVLDLVHCRGDANADGVVDFIDLNIVLGDFGMTGMPPGAIPGDLDADGDCDFTDLNIVLSAFGEIC